MKNTKQYIPNQKRQPWRQPPSLKGGAKRIYGNISKEAWGIFKIREWLNFGGG